MERYANNSCRYEHQTLIIRFGIYDMSRVTNVHCRRPLVRSLSLISLFFDLKVAFNKSKKVTKLDLKK